MDVKGNYIAGAWVIGDELLQDLNPSNLSDVVGEFSRSSAEQTRIAIAAAREAFKKWSHSSVQLRFEMLDRKLADDHVQDLATGSNTKLPAGTVPDGTRPRVSFERRMYGYELVSRNPIRSGKFDPSRDRRRISVPDGVETLTHGLRDGHQRTVQYQPLRPFHRPVGSGASRPRTSAGGRSGSRGSGPASMDAAASPQVRIAARHDRAGTLEGLVP